MSKPTPCGQTGACGEDGANDRIEEIRRRAHQLFLRRGERDGSELEDWLEAEAEVRQEIEQRMLKLQSSGRRTE